MSRERFWALRYTRDGSELRVGFRDGSEAVLRLPPEQAKLLTDLTIQNALTRT